MHVFRSPKILVAICLFSIFLPIAFPQTVELPPVIVEGVLPMSDLAPSAGTTSIDSATIEATAASDLPALLSLVSGVISSPTGANGADAVGGVIHIHTKRKTTTPLVEVSIQNNVFMPSSVTVGSSLSATTVPFVGLALIDGQSFDISTRMNNLFTWAKAQRAANNDLYP